MNIVYYTYFKSPFGELKIGSFQNELCLCDWRYRKQRDFIDSRIAKALNATFIEFETDIIKNTIKQLNEYFEGKSQTFDLPLKMIGTPFQISVWNELQKIPYGKTQTYMQLAKKIDQEKAVRAIAAANGANAISIIIPCHRIIGSNNELVGYAGGLNNKKKMLEFERSNTLGYTQLELDI